MKLTSSLITSLALRIGLAFVFVYAAIGSLVQPNLWIGFLPQFVQASSAAPTLLLLFSIGELLLAVWLLSGKFVQYPAILAALAMVGILLSQPAAISTTFRDIGLAFMAIALFTHESPELKRFLAKKARD